MTARPVEHRLKNSEYSSSGVEYKASELTRVLSRDEQAQALLKRRSVLSTLTPTNARAFQELDLSELSWTRRIPLNASYYAKQYGPYAFYAAVFAVSAYYTAGLSTFAPSMIPYGLTALTGWHQTAAASAFGLAALVSGALLLPRTYNEIKKLITRINHPGMQLSAADWALLATTTVLGVAFMTALYANPALLGLAAASLTVKLAVATPVAAVTAFSAYGMFKNSSITMPTWPSRSAPEVDSDNDSEEKEDTTSAPSMKKN